MTKFILRDIDPKGERPIELWLGLIILLIAAITCGGCVAGESADSSGQVREVKLKDGTRCVLYVGYYKGGITCDWGASK